MRFNKYSLAYLLNNKYIKNMPDSEVENNNKNKFKFSLILSIFLFALGFLEAILYYLAYDYMFAISTASLSVAIFLLILFICVMTRHEKTFKTTKIFVGIYAFSWLISSIPAFITLLLMKVDAFDFHVNENLYISGYFSFVGNFFGNGNVELIYPYLNFWLSFILILLIPGLFSNERRSIKEKENPAIISEDNTLQRDNHPKNRFRLAFVISIICSAFAIFDSILIVLDIGLFEPFIALYLGIGLLAVLVVAISNYKIVHFSNYISLSILAVSIFISSFFMMNLLFGGYYDLPPEEHVDCYFYGVFVRLVSTTAYEDGSTKIIDTMMPYPDLILSLASLIVSSIFFSRDRKKIKVQTATDSE